MGAHGLSPTTGLRQVVIQIDATCVGRVESQRNPSNMSAAALPIFGPILGLPMFAAQHCRVTVLRWRPMNEREQHAKLLQRVTKHGDRAAFAELFAHFAPRVKGFLMRGGASSQQAEELVQEVMLVVWSRAKTFDASRAAVSTWVFTIARNKRIDRIRKHKYAQVDLEDPALVKSERPSPESEAAHHQRSQAVRAALEDLPAPQREVLHSAYFEGRSQSEIAARLDLPIGTVKSRTRLATRSLQEKLATLRPQQQTGGESS
jgi:RNA polymerase sigma-70 factor (ECF subfamily)